MDNLPQPGKKYLVKVQTKLGHIIHTTAEWIPKYFRLGDYDEFEGDLDYSEELDGYYWPEGWYENQYTPDTNWLIHDPVVAFMEIPVQSDQWVVC